MSKGFLCAPCLKWWIETICYVLGFYWPHFANFISKNSENMIETQMRLYMPIKVTKVFPFYWKKCPSKIKKFELGISWQAEFSTCKFLIITQEISHIFCVSTCWNWQNCPIVTILNLHLTCLRFNDSPFRWRKNQRLLQFMI